MPSAPLRPVEAAERLAYKPQTAARLLDCSRQHVYNLLARGELRSVLIGASRRIPRSEIDRLLDGGGDHAGAA